MTYRAKHADLTRCPHCRSHRIACAVGQIFDFCMQCHKVWERIPTGEHFTTDGELLAFKTPCDNCAFRGKSPERLDAERWQELALSLAYGNGMFFCHKGVPCDIKNVREAGALEFEFPKKRKSVDIAGACHPYETWDTERMRLCRGYLNQHVTTTLKSLGLVPELLMSTEAKP